MELTDIKPTYYEELARSLAEKRSVILRTDVRTYFHDCIETLMFLTQRIRKNVLIITFDTNTRDIIETLKYSEDIDVAGISVIDAISIFLGVGTPPVQKLIAVHRPDSFEDIEVYTYLFLRKYGHRNTVILFLSLGKLEEFQTGDEIGIFLRVFNKHIQKIGVPEIILIHTSISFLMSQILSTQVDKIISYRKIPLVQ